MTLFATLFAYVLGLPMGVLLTVTKAGGVAPAGNDVSSVSGSESKCAAQLGLIKNRLLNPK